jgi:hypothetical protein
MKLKLAMQRNSWAEAIAANYFETCQQVLRQITRIRDSISTEARNTLPAHDQLMKLFDRTEARLERSTNREQTL